ncbi:hypothetical protein LCGC14_0713520 [marine sediment metagenome]|uniref:Uncharacterized protein n=1 Tax=marine sediment metagenome TaxID=412755 RepID=A0A0F9SZZ7_9ZZZZ
MAQMGKASADGDMDKVLAISTEIRKVKSAVNDAETTAQTKERDEVKAALTKGLNALNLADMLKGLTIKGTIRRTDTGLDDGRMVVEAPNLDAIWPVVDVAGAGKVSSVKRIEFTIANGKAEVTIGTAKGSGGGSGGQSGKGWVKDGEVVALQKAFDTVATTEEKANVESFKGDGSKQYTEKTKVVKANGYTLNQG